MKLTKDEARILGEVLSDGKYNLYNRSEKNVALIDSLEDLEKRLLYFGQDQRRRSRKSLNDFNDCLKRFMNKTV